MYLENRFSLRAPEQTTEEFLESVTHGDALEVRFVNLLKEFLERSDLVKFAKEQPLPNENEMSLSNAYDFVNGTKKEESSGPTS